MKCGLKLWSTNFELYPLAIDYYRNKLFDYIEIMYIPDQEKNIDILCKAKIPIIVHAPTESQNVYFSGNELEQNLDIFKKIELFANKLNAEFIIIHPDFGNKYNFIKFLKKIQNPKIIIENMPKFGIENKLAIGYTIEELKKFLEIKSFGFCLDFEKAMKSAIAQKKDYKVFIKELLKLKPSMYHISDGNMSILQDQHLNLGEGDIDLIFIKKLISSDKKVTFETPKINKLDNDLKNISYFKKL